MNDIKPCAVYAASSSLVAPEYMEAAANLGRRLAKEGIGLVYGAGKVGLMGAVADAALGAGGKVTGVIPQFMVDNGWAHGGLTDLIVTPDMHSRKEKIVSLADAAIALPGGVGTLEELCEVITWKQLGLFLKPIVILNVGGYYDPLLAMLESAARGHFMRPEHLKLWRVARDADEAVEEVLTTPLWDKSIGKFAQI